MKKPAAVPRCFVCQKPVDAMSRTAMRLLDNAIEYTVWCHGARETVWIPERLIVGMTSVEFGEAFAPKMLKGDEPAQRLIEPPNKPGV